MTVQKENYNLMRNIFAYSSLFRKFAEKLACLVLLNILWIACSVPLVTAGASSVALYTVAFEMAGGKKANITRRFFEAFKANFVQAAKITVLLAVTGVWIVPALHIIGMAGSRTRSILYTGCVVFFIIWGIIVTYIFPLIAKYKNTLDNTFSNIIKITVSHFPQTVFMLLANAVPFILYFAFPEIFGKVFWIWLFIGKALVAYINCIVVSPVLDKFHYR